jgi:hypothetical protein
LECIQTDEVRFWVANSSKLPDHQYWFSSNSHGFATVPITGRDNVRVETNGFSGKVTLYASNKFDTVSQDFFITRRTYLKCAIEGDFACLKPDTVLKFNLYPSPNVDVTWELPEGWNQDQSNPKSSTVYLVLDSNAVSGTIKASSKECSILFDTVFVSVEVNNYAKEGIISDNGVCFAQGDTATFRFKKDPNAKSYEWTFPDGWLLLGNPVKTDINDTVMKVIVGATMDSIKLTATTFCGEGWTMIFDSLYAKPSIEAISTMDKSCTNKGFADTITFVAETNNPNSVTHYQWLYPNTWTVQNANANTLVLITNEIIGDYTVYVVGTNEQCSQYTDTAEITISPVGIGIGDITIVYSEPLPLRTRTLTATSYPNCTYKWHKNGDYSEIIFSNGNRYALNTIDTINNSYSVVVTNTLTGCISQAWFGQFSLDDDWEYTDTIVKVTPPTPPANYSAPMTFNFFIEEDNAQDNSEEEPVETPPAPRQNAPKQTVPEVVVDNNPSFTFYPNPARGNIYVQFNGDADNIEILNMSGIILLKRRVTGSEQEISVSHLSIGMYIVRVTFGNKIVSEKLQIQK